MSKKYKIKVNPNEKLVSKNDNQHYCVGGEQHKDGCDCQCDFCNRRRKELERIEFNKKLSKRISEGYEKW
jgi:hypothetical protein